MHKGSLAVRNCPPANSTRYFLAPRRFDPKDFKAKNFARTYLSTDHSVATLLKDAIKIFGLNHTPTAVVRNDTGEVVTDLADVPRDTYLVPCYKVNEAGPGERVAVKLVRNTLPISPLGVKYHLKGMEQLLEDATKLLRLKEPAQAVFNRSGDPVLNLDKVTSGSVLIISCGEPCVISSVEESESSVVSKSELPPEVRPENIYNHLVAFANETVEQRLAMAELSIFASFPPENQKMVQRCDELTQRLQSTRMTGLVEQLVSNDILPPRTEGIAELLKQKSIELLAKTDLHKFRFVISGPRSSGKTSLLYSFACTALRKLIMCGEEMMFMPFVVNWARDVLLIDQPKRLYSAFIETALNGAKYSRFEFIQSFMPVKEYLLSVPSMTAFKKPPEGFEGLSDFVRKMITCFREAPDTLYAGLVQFPGVLAKILGFEYPLFIFDHFETAGEELCAQFAKVFRRSPFIIASQVDEAFYGVVKIADVTFVYTDNLLQANAAEDQDIISVPELKIQLGESGCLGSPAYLALFHKILKQLKLVRKQNRYSFVRSKADLSRELIIRQELFKLCVRLEAGGSKIITKQALNKLGDYDEHVTIQLLDKTETKKQPVKRQPAKQRPAPRPAASSSNAGEKAPASKPIFFDSGSESDKGDTYLLSQSSDDSDAALRKGGTPVSSARDKRASIAPPPKTGPTFDTESDDTSPQRKSSGTGSSRSSPKRQSVSKNDVEGASKPLLFQSSSDQGEPEIKDVSESQKDLSRRKSLSVPKGGFFDSSEDSEPAPAPAKAAPSVTSKKSNASAAKGFFDSSEDEEPAQAAPSVTSQKSKASAAKGFFDSSEDEEPVKRSGPPSRKASLSAPKKGIFDSYDDEEEPQKEEAPSSGSKRSHQSSTRASPSPVKKGVFDAASSEEDEVEQGQKMRPVGADDLSDGSDVEKVRNHEYDYSDDQVPKRPAPRESLEGKKKVAPPAKATTFDDDYYSDEEPAPAPARGGFVDDYSSDDAEVVKKPPPKNQNFDYDYYDD